MDEQEARPDSGRRSAAYRVVEGLHLRQWLARAAAPLAVLATNGAGLVALPVLPRHDAPLAWCGLPPAGSWALRAGGLLLVAAAVWFRVRAKGVLVRRTTLTTGGVYARVRHPFYLAALLGGAGVFLLAGALGTVVALAWTAAAIPVYAVTVAGEEEGLRALYPAAWDAYAAAVPRLLPRPGRCGPDAAAARITWENLVAEREPPRLLRFLAGAAAVLGCAVAGPMGTALLGAAALLLAASYALPGIQPRARRDG